MFRSSDVIEHKEKVPVLIRQDDGEVLTGYMYARGQDRVLDVMNGGDQFIPFETDQGKLLIIRKTQILRVEPRDDERMSDISGAAPVSPQSY
jgi:glucose/arabinose dehydrogenase